MFFDIPVGQIAGRGSHASGEAERSMCGAGNLTRAAYATAYDASCEIANFQDRKRSTKVALRGAIHVACLLVMFSVGRLAMPFLKREKVRHATLLFCAEGGNLQTIGVGSRMKNG